MNNSQRKSLANRLEFRHFSLKDFETACDEAYQLTDDETRREILDEGWTAQTQGWTECWEVQLGDDCLHVYFCEDSVLTIAEI